MYEKLISIEDVYHQQQVEKTLFEIEQFKPEYAVFPKQVFRKRFSHYLFLTFNDWFNNGEDYSHLQRFLQALNESVFFASAPVFHLLNPVKFTADCSHQDFVKGFTYSFDGKPSSPADGVGLRLSSQSLMYGESQAWAMVHDLTHNLIIVGIEDEAYSHFKTSFSKSFDIHGAIKQLELSQGATMDNTQPVIATYS